MAVIGPQFAAATAGPNRFEGAFAKAPADRLPAMASG